MLSEYEASVLMKDLASKRSRHFYSQRTIVIAMLLVIAATAWRQLTQSDAADSLHATALTRTAASNDTTARLERSDAHTGIRFFGFVEFDWDPEQPGNVPGFGPWPPSYAQRDVAAVVAPSAGGQ